MPDTGRSAKAGPQEVQVDPEALIADFIAAKKDSRVNINSSLPNARFQWTVPIDENIRTTALMKLNVWPEGKVHE